MNAMENRQWGRGRWGLTITLIFLAQVALIFVFREPSRETKRKSGPRFHLLAKPLTSSQLASNFFASDPTLFSAASLHSFSGPAWLRVQTPSYIFPEHNKPTNWLALDMNQLGLLPEVQGVPFAFEPEELVPPPSSPITPTVLNVRTQSVVRIEGGLASRALDVPANMPAEPFNGALRNSEVLFAVNQAGLVYSTRLLLEGRSGSPDADRKALGVARRLRFEPARSRDPQIVWSKLVIEWQTVPLAAQPSTLDEDAL